MFAAKDSLLTRPSGGYQISRSLRFNSADSAYLNRTPASNGNRRTFTVSTWVKRAALGTSQYLWEGGSPDGQTTRLLCRFNTDDTLRVATGSTIVFNTTQVFRDPSSWYHIVVAIDTPNGTQASRARLYVNGSEVTTFSSASYFGQNDDTGWNMAQAHSIGRSHVDSAGYLSAYLTEFYNVDGTQLTPSSFGETNAQTGVWQPKAYSGSYGTNGFYLNFSDNSNTTAATLGKDYSGNGNNWTPNNFSVTAGAGNDSLVDSPTSYGVDTGVGGTVRGNYATLNPLSKGGTHTLANGNLDFSISGATGSTSTFGTIGVSSGKWYWEMLVASTDGSYYPGLGVETNPNPALQSGGTSTGFMYLISGQKYNNGSLAAYGSSYTTNDVIGVALDMDAGTITFYKNNTSQGQAFSGITGTAFPTLIGQTGGSGSFNFGQRPFAYTAPSGFKALCTQNLPTPTIGATTATQAGKYFGATAYSGTSATQAIVNDGFQPDLIWLKSRNAIGDNGLYDSIRGISLRLVANNTNAEASVPLDSFNSNGFSTTSNYNNSGQTLIAWQWKANGSGSSNTAGSITSTVSANTTSGFSVVTYTGTGANATVGHGLGVAPTIIFIKNRSTGSTNWVVYNLNATSAVASARPMYLNTGNGEIANADIFNYPSTNTTTVFNIGTNAFVNTSSNNYVAYCFTPIAGYSAMNIFTGNGSADGPFVYCGFRPAYVLIKDTTNNGDWFVWDTARDTYNVSQYTLLPNSSAAETSGSANYIDILSNGFKIKATTAGFNTNTDKFLFMAFASAPFKFSLAR